MGVLFEDLGIAAEQVVRCNHEPHVTGRGNALDLRSKIAVSGLDDSIPAPPETLFQYSEHGGSFRRKKRVVEGGVFSEQDVHPSFLCSERK
jgi:hypothetical protein